MTARPAISIAPVPETTAPFRLLGFSAEEYFYLSETSGIVVALTASAHTDLNLNRIAADDYWQAVAPGKHGPNYKWAAKDLLAAQHRIGFFDPSKLRGVGCWLEGTTVVFHAGDRLYINGKSVPLHAHQSPYVYPRRSAIPIDLSRPGTTEDGQALSTLCSMLAWRNPDRFWVFAGWLMCGMVCGALPWRPHLWINGGSGTGKSWTFAEIVQPILGPLALYGQSSTTEAGIRQTHECDALATALDEMETNNDTAIRRARPIFELSRQSSSETGAPILKGSASGEARNYRCRSCFLFLSIAVGATEQADENRIAKMELVESGDEARFAALKAFWATCIGQPGYCDRLRARAVTQAPLIRAAYEIFRASITRAAKSSRVGQQMGALAAGYWCLLHDDLPTQPQADLWVEKQDWSDQSNSSQPVSSDPERCLEVLLQTRIVMESDNGPKQTVSIANALSIFLNEEGGRKESAKAALDLVGIAVPRWWTHIHIANRHPELSRIFRGSQFEEKWRQYLLRIPGAKDDEFRSSGMQKNFKSVKIHVDVAGIRRTQPDLPGGEA